MQDVRLAPGDELLLSYEGELRSKWEKKGVVLKVPDSRFVVIIGVSDEIGIELKKEDKPPTDLTLNFTVSFVWKPTSFDRYVFHLIFRMQNALKTFAIDDGCVSFYIYQKLLGHDVEPQPMKSIVPKRVSAPNLPELNHSQVGAVKSALQKQLSLIQGPPG